MTVSFVEQADRLWIWNTPPTARLFIQKSGIGMNHAEDVSHAFPHVVGGAFKKASKERWCTEFKILLQRVDLDRPRPRTRLPDPQHQASLHPSGDVSFDVECTGRGHADRFWGIVLACQKAVRAEPLRRGGGAGNRVTR